MKYIICLCSLFLFCISVEAKPKGKWKTVEVLKVVDNERFMLKSQKVIRIIGIDAPDIFVPTHSEKCLTRPIYRTMESLLEGKTVKIFEDGSRDENGDFSRHIKLGNGSVLTEFLLEKGLAKISPNYTKEKYLARYKKAEKLAKDNKLGLWGGCNAWNDLKKRRKRWGTYPVFYEKYGQFLASISVGRVGTVTSGNRFELENGLKVRLIGVSVPQRDKDSGADCFSKKSQKYLKDLILGKKVFLVSDRSQLDEDGDLLRYVYLAYGNKFVNKDVIQSGYGKSAWDQIDERYKKVFDSLQTEVYKTPCGAWKSCVSELVNVGFEVKKEIIELVYDENCRIKGNISGTKKNPKKTYHTPLSGWYKRIVAEACFDDEVAAEASGFMKVK